MNRDREAIAQMTDAQIKHMVERFLRWKLPENFNPDDGISFKRTYNDHLPTPGKNEPSGTNLFDYTQATATVRNMVEGLPPAGGVEEALRELLEAVNWRDEPGGLDRLTATEELAAAALSPTTLGGRSGSAQDGLPPARSLPSALTSAGPAPVADQSTTCSQPERN